MICLDTNAAIAVINGIERMVKRLSDALVSDEGVAVPVIVAVELLYGAEHSARRAHNIERVRTFLAGPVDVLPFDADDASEAARVREELTRVGMPIGPYDILIAAQSRRRDAALVTDNGREFGRVSGLRTINWLRS
jgi:tRNA(fMet)-specific endonuclease VapC